MLLCLPYSLGGYGLPHPTMNAEMPLPKNVAATGRSSLRCDLYWPAARLDVEYDSAEFHSAERLLASDSMRRIALESMDVTSVNLTAEHLRRASLFDEAAQGIARILREEGARCQAIFASNKRGFGESLQSCLRIWAFCRPWERAIHNGVE